MIIHGDALDEMRKLPTDSVDLVLTGLPADGCEKTHQISLDDHIQEIFRISKHQIIFAAKWHWPLFPTTNTVIIVKYEHDLQMAWCSSRDKHSYFYDMKNIRKHLDRSWDFIDPLYGGPEFYTRRLATEATELIIEQFTSMGDIVMDPFCGTGTVPIAANKLGRKYIGIEIKKKWYDYVKGQLN